MFEALSPLVEDPQPDAHRVVRHEPVMTTQRRRLHEAASAPSARTRPPPSMAAYMEGHTGVVGTTARVRLSLGVGRGGGVEAQTSVVQQIRALTRDEEWPMTPPPDVAPTATVTERVCARVRLTLRVSHVGVVSAQSSVVPRPTIYGHVALLQLQPPSCAERRLRRRRVQARPMRCRLLTRLTRACVTGGGGEHDGRTAPDVSGARRRARRRRERIRACAVPPSGT